MTSPLAEKLRDAVSQAHWNEAVALLQTSEVADAADALGHLPFEQQQALFRHLPLDLAADVVAGFPYYHQYVLLHSLPVGEMRPWLTASIPTTGCVCSMNFRKKPGSG